MVKSLPSLAEQRQETKSHQGMSIMSSLLMVTIVSLIAATMVAVYSMNLAMTQRTYNGSIAMAEAEAGIAEVLYMITLPENFENPEGDPTKVVYGREGETIRSTATPGYTKDEAFHYVSFANGPYPRSTNNCFGDRSAGSLDRTVPNGAFHIVSTGYCKGQYRTVEAVLEKPAFPFGLAASGEIHSRDPFIVKGVRTIAELLNDEETRPGHILCNSPEGVIIETGDSGRSTYVSGFIKSVGPIEVEQPATVLGGIRPFSDESSLTIIDVTLFRNEGQPGVVTLLDDTYVRPQEKDIMYFYSGPMLTYESSVHLDKAMLYVEGDLLIRGPVTGEGLIVVNGNATFESGTTLSGANKMAVICSGDVTIRGNDNYFTGLVYSGGNFDASNVTVVGNTIVNSIDPTRGRADLTNVTFVSNLETADMQIEATSSSASVGQYNGPDFMFPLMIGEAGYFGLDPTWDYEQTDVALPGWFNPAENSVEDGVDWLKNGLLAAALDPSLTFPALGMDPSGDVSVWVRAKALYELAAEIRSAKVGLLEDEDRFERANLDGLPPEEIEGIQASMDLAKALIDELSEQFEREAEGIVNALKTHMETHADGTGRFLRDFVTPDVTKVYHFNLNEYLPESEKVKVMFWRVYNRKF